MEIENSAIGNIATDVAHVDKSAKKLLDTYRTQLPPIGGSAVVVLTKLQVLVKELSTLTAVAVAKNIEALKKSSSTPTKQ